ncbi:hypothetical protein HJG60_009335 [Phyllostomus discolor]|uniref:Uncharacterized protein n=1 Tax=Phyllostomus discolor TaxID=89673 RepID=A0A833YFH7_9CHIR|nr:hypothetical protein HJG60_009335 [Phyllostomus discolor]
MQTPARSVHIIMDEMRHSHGLPSLVEGKHGLSLKGSKSLGPCHDWPLLGFLAHYMMVLIYYAQVCFRWLPFTENKGANAITEEGYLQMKRQKWLNWLHSSLEGLAWILGSYFAVNVLNSG